MKEAVTRGRRMRLIWRLGGSQTFLLKITKIYKFKKTRCGMHEGDAADLEVGMR